MEKDQQQQQQQQGEAGNAQRFPSRMLNVRKGNTEVRDGKCFIITRSEMDPRWPLPQFIDESVMDRNRLESLNMQRLNPDVIERRHVKCLCTRLLSITDDWYVQTHDGTILCNTCTRCFRCFTICFTAGRKMNSIDGFVLCNTCMLSYGSYREKKLRLRVQPLPRTLGDLETDAEDGSAGSMPAGATGQNNTQTPDTDSNCSNDAADKPINEMLTAPRFRDEGRRPLRLVYYPNPRPANYGRPDYRFEAPPYLGVDRNEGCGQACPECGHQALAEALVVTGTGRVYHERSFRCDSCKRPMHMGYQTPVAQFESCSCLKQPKVWCSAHQCRVARMAHHADKSCQLEPVHPGGRPKRDVPGFLPRFDPATVRKPQAPNQAKKLQPNQAKDSRLS